MVLKFCFSIATPPDLEAWTRRAETFDNLTDSVSTLYLSIIVLFEIEEPFLSCETKTYYSAQVRIAMVGKYVGLTDSYLSVVKV